MNPISTERVEFLKQRNKMLELMLKEIGTNSNRYAAFSSDPRSGIHHQVKLNIETEMLQNLVEINTYVNFIQ